MTFAVLGPEVQRADVWALLDDRTRALIDACDRHRHFEVIGLQFVGASDTVAVVVDAGDTILVMSKSAAQDMKALNAQLAETHPELL